MRLAFVGVDHPHGAHWRQLMANFTSDLEIVALVPAFGGTLASLEERFADLPRFKSVEELNRWGQFDGAMVCLPNSESPAAMLALARAGKHLLVEKPTAGCSADFDEAAAAIRVAGVAFQTGYLFRYDEGANRLREMARDRRFGKLISVEMTYVTSDITRRGPGHYLFDPAVSQHGFFNWLACHHLDLLLYVTGEAVVGVTARVGTFGSVETGVEDGGTAILELSGGGIATLIGGYWLPRWAGETKWTLRGDQRWVHWDMAKPGTNGELEIHGPQPQWHAMEETYSIPKDETPGYGGRRGLGLVQDWLAAANAGDGTECRNTVRSTIATLKLLDAIYESSRLGRRVECRIEG